MAGRNCEDTELTVPIIGDIDVISFQTLNNHLCITGRNCEDTELTVPTIDDRIYKHFKQSIIIRIIYTWQVGTVRILNSQFLP